MRKELANDYILSANHKDNLMTSNCRNMFLQLVVDKLLNDDASKLQSLYASLSFSLSIAKS